MTLTADALLTDPSPTYATHIVPSRRERDVLKLLAQGFSTRDVARTMCYSERTIKSIVHHLTLRMNLRNRTQAVAVAICNGWI